MKRVASDFPSRHDYPATVLTSEETRAGAIDDATRQPAGMTIEQLRSLRLPPFAVAPYLAFENNLEIYLSDEVDESSELARVNYDGYKEEDGGCSFELMPLLSFCTKHECHDALVWFLMRTGDKNIYCGAGPDLDARQIRYLMACLNRLPEPITLHFYSDAPWVGACWDAFVDALQECKGIKGFRDPYRVFSEQEAERFLAAIHDHPVIEELGIGFTRFTAPALNHYLAHNRTLSKLELSYNEADGVFPGSDITPALLANRTLTSIKFLRCPVTPALIQAIVAPGKALTSLQLVHCTYAAGTLEALGSALADNDTLSSLSIDSNFINSLPEAKTLHEGLRFNRGLVSLDLRHLFNTPTHIISLWEMMQVNLTLCNIRHGLHPNPSHVTDPRQQWALVPHVRQRLKENKELASFCDQYPMAKLAFSILPGNLPDLPPDVSGHIARFLLKTDASALPTYRTLHMLALHKEIKAQDKPSFPDHPDFSRDPAAQRLAQCGAQALPLAPDIMRHMALLCIRHKASQALDWMVVHACKGELDLRASQFEPGEAGWLIQWTRAAPCHIKLRLDNVPLRRQDIADIAQQLTGNPALTSLSLNGCAMAAADLELICEALKANMAMVEMLLSEELIALGGEEIERSGKRTTLEDRMVADGNGMLIQVPAQTFATSLENLARYRDGIARLDLNQNTFRVGPTKYLLLATIAFALRRNRRLQNRVPTSDDLLPDKAFENAIHILPDA